METHFALLATIFVANIAVYFTIQYLTLNYEDAKKDKAKIMDLLSEKSFLIMNVMKSELSLKLLSIQFLKTTGAFHARGVFEMYQNRYLTYIGSAKEKWTNFLRSNTDESNELLAVLGNRDIESAVLLAVDLYSILSNEVYKSLKYSDYVYIIRDILLEDQLKFLCVMAEKVIDQDRIHITSKNEYEAIINDFLQKLEDAP